MNWWRLLVLPDPDVAAHAETFDELLACTGPRADVVYDLAQPKWWFLHHLVRSGYLLHGSNEREIEEFRPRSSLDAHNENRVDGVFASDDAVWPMYFAVVNRPVAQSYINWCEHVPGASRYLFSIGSDPSEPESWTTGAVYVLPHETFAPTPGSRELISHVPVRPRARLTVDPGDFPFRRETRGHRRGESVRSVALRNLFRLPSPR